MKKMTFLFAISALLLASPQLGFCDDDDAKCRVTVSFEGIERVSQEDGDSETEALKEAKEEACEKICEKLEKKYDDDDLCEEACERSGLIKEKTCRVKGIESGKAQRTDTEVKVALLPENNSVRKDDDDDDDDKYRCFVELTYEGISHRASDDAQTLEKARLEAIEEACDKVCDKLKGVDDDACERACTKNASISHTYCASSSDRKKLETKFLKRWFRKIK